MTNTDTIYALSSATGKAGVAVVRVSGPQAGVCLRTLAGDLPDPRMAVLRTLRQSQSSHEIDQALVIWFPGPGSFTGEDCAEFQVHGGRAVLSALLDTLAETSGCRPAEAGEFARRAFENGKLDLTQAEGLADLIDAQTEAQRRQAIRQADGALYRLYEAWRQNLIECLALQEASIDFSDEPDVVNSVTETAQSQVKELVGQIGSHLDDGNRGEILRDGFQVVLAGPPNAGKSSLLNALARRDVAIVSTEAGTTRDIIEVRLDLDGLPIIISDTAGIRKAEGAVEQMGVERSLARAHSADLILWLSDATQLRLPRPDEFNTMDCPVLDIGTKSDLRAGSLAKDIPSDGRAMISVVTGDGIEVLTARIAQSARTRLTGDASPALTQHRHRQNLVTCQTSLMSYLAGDLKEGELRAEDLRQAATALGRITGHVDVEDVLDRVFSSFCIGK